MKTSLNTVMKRGANKAHLRIYGEIRDEYLNLVVENNGRSMTNEELTALKNKVFTRRYTKETTHSNIGLKNIHDRLVLNYDQHAGIKLDSMQGQGFSVKLVIPSTSRRI